MNKRERAAAMKRRFLVEIRSSKSLLLAVEAFENSVALFGELIGIVVAQSTETVDRVPDGGPVRWAPFTLATAGAMLPKNALNTLKQKAMSANCWSSSSQDMAAIVLPSGK